MQVAGDGGLGGDHQRVAIGRGLGHHIGADDGRRTDAVLHQHRLAPALTETLGHGTRQDVDGTSRRPGHDDAHRTLRPGGIGRRALGLAG